MKRSKSLGFVALLMTVTLLAAGCASKKNNTSGGSGGANPDVTLYFQGALTGPANYLILPSFQGAQLHINELNAQSDFPAHITLKQADTQGDPAQAPQVVQEVVSDPNTVGVIGPGFSGESAASGDTYNQAKIPFVTPSATNTTLDSNGWDYWYRAVGNDSGQGGLGGAFIAKVIAPSKLFVIHDKSDYGQPLATTVKTTAQKDGVKIVGFEGITSGADDFSAVISDIKASGADCVFFGGYDFDFGKIVSQAKDSGLNIDFMSGDGSLSSTFLKLAGPAAENVYLSAATNLSGDFAAKYNASVGSKASSVPVYAAEGYDVAGLFGAAIRSAVGGGATDPTAIRAGIQKYLSGLTTANPYTGVAKNYSFDSKHEVQADSIADLYYYYQVKNGKMKPLGNAAQLNL
ncbi:MAG TPA: branched-chain amino acid ABC transporter substrate-binding protein [Actinomycetota bacterium]|nr:branched-chain amino acid ABC transporter substrate-binding protein [Actinomycetota bacterium]